MIGSGVALQITFGWQLVVVLVALFAASFFFSGTETAFFSLQKVDRDVVGRRGRTGRLVNELREQPTELITTILMGNEIANVALTTIGASLTVALFPDYAWLNILFLTPLLVLISEITPKVLALRFRRGWSFFAAWPIRIFSTLIWPIRFLFSAVVGLLARTLGASGEPESADAEAELMVLVERSAASGELNEVERDTIERRLEFDESTVERLMTPRPDVFSVPLNTPWEKLVKITNEHRFSRVPIRDEDSDELLGILLLKDLLRHRVAPFPTKSQLRKMLLNPMVVPPSKPADDMLREFLSRRVHMAFVIDEHGTHIGIITLDDLLGELFGDDDESESSEIAVVRPNQITVKGSMDVEDFHEETDVLLPTGEYHTVAGFVFHQLGTLPKLGDTVDLGAYQFVVAAMEGRRVSEVLVTGLTLPQDSQ